MSLKEINKKFGSKEAKIRFSVRNLNINPDSPLFCDNCKKKLGLIHMLRQSIKVKPGVKYIVTCKKCKTLNSRVKGEIGKQIDKTWDKYGF